MPYANWQKLTKSATRFQLQPKICQKSYAKTSQKSFMKITTKKLPSEKFYSFGYLIAELKQYELKTFYDGKNFAHKFVGFTPYKAKKRFIEMIELGIVKGFNKDLTK